ncbi:MAG: CPBP family intramembrane metalloprotease [Aureibaculum sp.]|nr:CPBP family intramembrane metalloprotease [Aureibaculum sp.]
MMKHEHDEQYSLVKILTIWASVTVPMGLIFFVVTPFLIPKVDMNPGILYLILITLGLVWQGVVAYIILKKEVKPFTWENLKKRLWLNAPISPKRGTPSKKLYLLTIPIIAFLLFWDNFGVLESLNEIWVTIFPFLAKPEEYGALPDLVGMVAGQWWILGVIFVLIVFNYLLGEELIFRGILLPKMNGVFGKHDWIANGILFALYHVHMIWQLPSQILFRDWIYSWAAKRYKSYWVSAIIHGFDAIVVLTLITMAII